MNIRVEVVNRSIGGNLSIIPSIPNHRPCLIEGRNGIGKSLAIRLLVLASGKQVYANNRAAWLSLKNSIGSSEVRLSGLSGRASTATLTFTPLEWPTEPQLEIGDWLGQLTLDDAERPASELFELLTVEHLVGTERLSHILDHARNVFASAALAASSELRTSLESRTQVGSASRRVARMSPRGIEEERSRRTELKSLAQSCADRLSILEERHGNITQALNLEAAIRSSSSDDRSTGLTALRLALSEAEARLTDLDKDIEAITTKLERGTNTEKEIARLERRSDGLRKTRQSELGRSLEFTRSYGLERIKLDLRSSDTEQLTAVDDLFLKAEAERSALERRAYLSQLNDLEREIHEQMRIVLRSALDKGGAGFEIAKIGRTSLTVEGLYSALQTVKLKVAVDDSELRSARAVEKGLKELADFLRGEGSFLKSLKSVETELALLKEKQENYDSAEDELASLKLERLSKDETISDLAFQITTLTGSALSPSRVEETKTLLSGLLSGLEIEMGELASENLTVSAELLEQRDLHARTAAEMKRSEDDESLRLIERESFRDELFNSPSLAWLADAFPPPAENARTADAYWAGLSEALSLYYANLEEMAASVDGLSGALRGNDHTSEFGRAIDAVVEKDTINFLSEPSIADALFDGGELTSVDVAGELVTWISKEKVKRTRPLSTFSSGQQALGFMRARLSELGSESKQNRIVFLDEFGAFIAADRRRPLAALLSGTADGGLAAEIVVVLPLQTDYEAQLAETTGELHDRYQERVKQIDEFGYFAELFVA